MNVLVIDVGGTHVKILATGQEAARKFVSGPTMAPQEMVAGVKKLSKGWKYDAVSIGYPGLVLHNRIVSEPHNLARGWVGFDFKAAFDCPVKLINDAAMQASGGYKGGKMLFLGLGPGSGPLYRGWSRRADGTWPSAVQARHLRRLRGCQGPREAGAKGNGGSYVADVIERLVAALEPDDVVLGGGNVKCLKELPKGCREGDNANAFVGGFRLWEQEQNASKPSKARSKSK